MSVMPRPFRRLGLLAAVLVAASMAPLGTLAADPVGKLDASWTVTRPDGSQRTDGSIAEGDDLALEWTLVGMTAEVDYCQIQIWTVDASVWVPANVDGQTCRVEMRLPDIPKNAYRYNFGGNYLDLCVTAAMILLEGAGNVVQLVDADHNQPGGRDCGFVGEESVTLDFRIDEEGGTDRPFVSDPAFLSWDVSDWDTGMGPMRFGEPYTVTFPDDVAICTPYLNGTWQTSVRPAASDPCTDWVVRVPGIMPEGFDYGGHVLWDTFLVGDYRMADAGEFRGFYHVSTHMAVPVEPTDGVFQSNKPAIFPIDLASTRFVVAGETWRPTFQVASLDTDRCRLWVYEEPGDDMTAYDALVDEAGQCTFETRSWAAEAWNQYYVEALLPGSGLPANIDFMGTITGIAPVPPPVIDPPTLEPDDDSVIDVEPGTGQGLLVELEVEPATSGSAGLLAAATTAAADTCTDQALAKNVEFGGSIPDFTTVCDLPPGTYTATATKLDVAGSTTTASRTFSVPMPRPRVSAKTPSASATGVSRDVRPTVTFDVPVSGVSASSVRLIEVATGAVVSGTLSYHGASRTATVTPSGLLKTSRQYRLQVGTAVKRADTGRAITSTSWTFTTTSDGTPPTIVGRTPGSGATLVPAAVTPAIRFSEGIKGVGTSTLKLKDTVTGTEVPATVRYDASTKRATIDPTRVLVAGRRYQVLVRSGIADLAGNPQPTTTWSFTVDPTDRRIVMSRG